MPFENPTKQRKPHTRYYLKDGTRVPNVTAILGRINKPYLVRWANQMGLKGLDSDQHRDEAADIGKCAHAMIESTLRWGTPDNDPLDFTPDQKRKAQYAYNNWLRWYRDFEVKPILIEQQLVSERFRYGGTLDLVANVDGEPELIDFKTSNSLHGEMLLQLSAYRWALYEQEGIEVNRVRIVRISKELAADEPWESLELENTDEHFAAFVKLLRADRALRDLGQ